MILASAATSSSGSSGSSRRSRASAPAIAVVSFSNPFYSALALIGNLASLAVLYLLLSAEFVAAAQVLVYAGAVMVMFLFVIAYLGGRATRRGRAARAGRQLGGGRRRGGAPRRGDRRRRPEGGRPALRPRPRSTRAFGSPARDRPAVPDRPPARVRDHLDRAARRRGRRRRSSAATRARTPAEDEAGSERPRRRLVPGRRGVPVRDRRARRADPPQPADRAALARDHAQRRRTSP